VFASSYAAHSALGAADDHSGASVLPGYFTEESSLRKILKFFFGESIAVSRSSRCGRHRLGKPVGVTQTAQNVRVQGPLPAECPLPLDSTSARNRRRLPLNILRTAGERPSARFTALPSCGRVDVGSNFDSQFDSHGLGLGRIERTSVDCRLYDSSRFGRGRP